MWRVLAMLLGKLPISLLGLALAAAPVLLTISLAGLGISGLAGDDGRLVGPWALGPAVGLGLCLLALPATVVSIAVLEGSERRNARWLARCCVRARHPRAGRCASCWPSGSATAR